MSFSETYSYKPHIGRLNGRWALWVERGRGVPSAVPGNTFADAAAGARFLRAVNLRSAYYQQLMYQPTRRP